jgi:hypothetical protein
VVDDEIDRRQRIDDLRFEPGAHHGTTHRRQISNAGTPGESCIKRGGAMRDLFGRRRRNRPVAERLDVLFLCAAVFEAQRSRAGSSTTSATG